MSGHALRSRAARFAAPAAGAEEPGERGVLAGPRAVLEVYGG